MLEAVISGIIIIGFVIALSNLVFFQEPAPNLSEKGYAILKELENTGKLRDYVSSENFTGLQSEINIPGYAYSIEICDSQGTCNGNRPVGKNVWLSSYIIAGDGDYEPKVIKLYIWREE